MTDQEKIALITKFYTAFQQQDAASMNACYHQDVVFEDPAFGQLKGARAKAMWSMLTQQAEDFKLTFTDVTSNSAHWEAKYLFSKTGNQVHNKIDAQFEFKDGLIIKHTDDFNLHQWASQAMGFVGKIIGGTGFFKKSLQKQTNKLLESFIKKNG